MLPLRLSFASSSDRPVSSFLRLFTPCEGWAWRRCGFPCTAVWVMGVSSSLEKFLLPVQRCYWQCLWQRNSTGVAPSLPPCFPPSSLTGVALRLRAALRTLLIRAGDRYHPCEMIFFFVCNVFCFGFGFLTGRRAPRALGVGSRGGLLPAGWPAAGHHTHPTAPLACFSSWELSTGLEMSYCWDHRLVPQMISPCSRSCRQLREVSSPGELVAERDGRVSS